jgi:hypothetical protein
VSEPPPTPIRVAPSAYVPEAKSPCDVHAWKSTCPDESAFAPAAKSAAATAQTASVQRSRLRFAAACLAGPIEYLLDDELGETIYRGRY